MAESKSKAAPKPAAKKVGTAPEGVTVGQPTDVAALREADAATKSMPVSTVPEAQEGAEPETEGNAPTNYDPELQKNPTSEDIGAVGKLDRDDPSKDVTE